jgi:threonine dehydrogenase-like Zn-dependent dehydrogenase
MQEMPGELENRSETVAIIGAGPLGRWLALAAARAGFRVQLEDVMPANLHHAQELLRQQLGPQPSAEAPPALKGHGFSRADGTAEGGGGFNPRVMPAQSEGALAPEGSPYIQPLLLAGALQAAENPVVLKGHDFRGCGKTPWPDGGHRFFAGN